MSVGDRLGYGGSTALRPSIAGLVVAAMLLIFNVLREEMTRESDS
jgi:hypothetical protein